MSLNYTEVLKHKKSCMMSILQPIQQNDFLLILTENERMFFENICNNTNEIHKKENKCLVLHLFHDCIKLKSNK